MLYVFFISFFRVSSVLLNRVKMLYPFPHTSTLRFFAPLLSSLLLLHTFIQTLWGFSYKMKRKKKRAYKHKSCVNKYCCKLAVFHELFSRWLESPCQMPPFAFKTVFNTNTTSLYIPFVFVLLLHFWVSESFPSNTYRWACLYTYFLYHISLLRVKSMMKKYEIFICLFSFVIFSFTNKKMMMNPSFIPQK